MIRNGRAIGNDISVQACTMLQNLQTFSLFFKSATNCEVVISLLLELYVKLNYVTTGNSNYIYKVEEKISINLVDI